MPQAEAPVAGPRPPSFWNELYWFVAIGLLGWIIAAIVLPPRIAGVTGILRQERRALADIRVLQEQENLLEGAVSAMENDPFYREGVFRVRLRIKKDSEDYLERPPFPVR